ncbi:hypothetical protein BGZ61DRAFT_199219 [Ilyonectria robusta]|uniref:uncharacterized protein n=1 Tax=Ilyonectria robusta TaxID=1079257 RepID=UPI001E8CF226|nr:uncharacterized protein BGZ61DRAFT_199219 [Ilyonectria robusta]KAH8722071.1 hypothetical protein BGZ61DRAFT_199219 [Ilyonectria robusta]
MRLAADRASKDRENRVDELSRPTSERAPSCFPKGLCGSSRPGSSCRGNLTRTRRLLRFPLRPRYTTAISRLCLSRTRKLPITTHPPKIVRLQSCPPWTPTGVAAPLSSDELEWPKCPESLKNSRYWHRGRATPGPHCSGHYSGALSRPNPSNIEQGQEARSASDNGSRRVRHALGPICTAFEVFLRLHACPRLDSSSTSPPLPPYHITLAGMLNLRVNAAAQLWS